MRVLIALVAWVGAVAAAAAVSTAVASSIHTSATTTTGSTAPFSIETTTTTTAVPTAPAFDASSVKPTDPNSLFIGSNFARILAVAKLHLGARADVEATRLTPGALQLITVDKHNRQSAVVVNADGSYTSVSNGPLNGSTQVYYLSQLGASVPSTLAKRIAAHGHVPISKLGYMLVTTDPSTQSFYWRVYPATAAGIYFQAADATGPIQELGGKQTITIR
jgi:hypothetical protein